jgi:anaerobic magnesium-protoporphyrin IX monomethyl ester cyclase
MRACFINTPIQDFYYTSIRRQPLGLLYIMAYLETAGHEVTLINGHSLKRHAIPLPEEFSYLTRYIESGDPTLAFPFARYCHFGMSFDEIQKRIAQSHAEIFFISCMFTPYYEESDRVIAMVRESAPGAIIVVGGYHSALYPEYYLQTGGADFVIQGEGEESAVALLRALESGAGLSHVPNLVWRDGHGIVRNERRVIDGIDRLPRPARKYLAQRDFRAYRRRAAAMITSRGCPNRCGFCSSGVIWGRGQRLRSVDAVLDEIRECAEELGATMIIFEDDNIFSSPGRAADLLGGLAAYQAKSGIALDLAAMNGVSLEGMDEGMVELMRGAGFRELNISLMSHSGELQAAQGRPFDSARFARFARAGRRAGMNVRAYFILGLPGQTAREVRDTVEFLKGLDVSVFPSVYYNVRAPRSQWKMQRSSAFYNETKELSRDDLMRLFNECRVPRHGTNAQLGIGA